MHRLCILLYTQVLNKFYLPFWFKSAYLHNLLKDKNKSRQTSEARIKENRLVSTF